MTSGENYEITADDIDRCHGKGICEHMEECIYRLDSKVCGLVRGYKHPQCPVNIKLDKELLKDPEYVKMQESIHQLAVGARQFLEKIRKKI